MGKYAGVVSDSTPPNHPSTSFRFIFNSVVRRRTRHTFQCSLLGPSTLPSLKLPTLLMPLFNPQLELVVLPAVLLRFKDSASNPFELSRLPDVEPGGVNLPLFGRLLVDRGGCWVGLSTAGTYIGTFCGRNCLDRKSTRLNSSHWE